MRYRLLPYIYSLAGQVYLHNYTIMRSLSFDFPDDPNVHSIPDQYMFGQAFLVNPVTEPLYTGSKAKEDKHTLNVYLPASAQWYDFWTGKNYKGGQTIKADAPLNIIPLYVKAGSIVPMGPTMEYATEKPGNDIELRIYPGANGEFTLYEDENDNYNYEKGRFATIKLSWNDKNRRLTVSDTQGHFPGMLKQHTFHVVLVNGTGGKASTTFNKSFRYNGKAISVML